MSVIRTIFWNSAQARLRTGWRFVALIALFLLIVVAFQVAASLVIFGIGAATGALRPGENVMLGAQRLASESFPTVLIVDLLTIALMFLIFQLAARWIDRRPFADYGFHWGRGWWLDLGFGLALGALMLAIMFGIELAAGWITITGSLAAETSWGFWPGFIAAVVGFVLVGFREEMIFRSYFMKNLAEVIPTKWRGPQTPVIFAWLASSIVFGAAHLGNPNATPMAGFNIFLAGLLLGLPYLLTGEVAAPIGVHITWNLFQNNVFGFPVSGYESTLSVITISQGGPELWTGGLFGPEAGLIAIPVMLLGAGLTVLWSRWRKGSGGMALSLAEPPASTARLLPEAMDHAPE